MKLLSLPLLALLCNAAGPALAEEPLVTDRPDFVESSEVVGRGRWQVETGLDFTRDSADGLRTRAVNTGTLLRFGNSATTELRLETDGLARVKVTDESTGASSTAQGMSDLALGIKWHAQDGQADTNTPSVAWLLHVDLPTGAADLRGHGARPSLRAVAEWDLPHDMSVGVMPGVISDTDEQGQRFTAGILAATLGKDFAGGVHAFVELAGQQIASSRHGGNVVTFDTGAALRLTDDLQLDVSLMKGLTRTSPDLQVGLGLSARF